MELYFDNANSLQFIAKNDSYPKLMKEMEDFLEDMGYTPPYVRISILADYVLYNVGAHDFFFRLYQ